MMKKQIIVNVIAAVMLCLSVSVNVHAQAPTSTVGSGQSIAPLVNGLEPLFSLFGKISIPTLNLPTTPTPPGGTPNATPTQAYDKTGMPIMGGKPNFVYYCQGNTEWKRTCSLGGGGCGPTSMAMILSSFGLTQYTPPVVDAEFRKNNARGGPSACDDRGSDAQQLFTTNTGWLTSLGIVISGPLASGGTLQLEAAKRLLDRGFLIFASSTNFPIANALVPGERIGHIFVVDDVDVQTASVDIRDPNNCSYADGNDENSLKRSYNVSDFNWLYAYALMKQP